MAHEDELKKIIVAQRLERLKKAIAHLITIERISQKSIQKDIAEQMGYNNKVTISNALNGNVRYLTESFLKRFCKTYAPIFNINWLITGEGEMINKKESNIDNSNNIIAHGYNTSVNKGIFSAPVITNFGASSDQSYTKEDFELLKQNFELLKQENEELKKDNERLKNELLKERERLINIMYDNKK